MIGAAGSISRALLLVMGVLALATLAWWLFRRGPADQLRPLENPPVVGQSTEQRAVEDETRDHAPYPGRRRLTGAGAPEGVDVGSLGTERAFGDGHRVRVTDYEATLRYSAGEGVDLVVDLARVEACAGSARWIGGALASAYHLAYPRPTGGFDLRPASSGLTPREPPLSRALTGDTLAAADCGEGWVTFALGTPGDFDDRLPTAIVFDNTSFEFVPPNGRGRLAWGIGE